MKHKKSIIFLHLITLLVLPLLVSGQESTTIVFGQADFTQGAANRGGAVDAGTLNYPLGILVDSQGGLYIADRNNHRVLYFANDGDTVADRVWGQHGSFTAHIANNNGSGNSGAPSASNMMAPTAIALDANGGLYIADRDNHRVLYFANDGDTVADRVYGQFGSFTVNMTSNDGSGAYGEPSAENLGVYVLGLVLDADGGLYVADSANHRVLYFANDGDTVADRVYGQCDNFTSGVRNNDCDGRIGAPSALNLNFPRGLAVDAEGGLYVADRDNNRILYFANDGDTVADRVYGQFGDFTSGVAGNDGSGSSGAPTADNLAHPKSVMVDGEGGVYIADSEHHRVLYYAPDGDTTADRVWGQFDSFTTAALNNDGNGGSGLPSEHNLFLPQGLALDGRGRLYVTDTGNNRGLILELGR